MPGDRQAAVFRWFRNADVLTALGVLAGVAIFRVHDVRPNRQAADVAWTIRTLAEERAT